MKIATIDRVYDQKTGVKTREAFVSFEDGSQYKGLFPSYQVGDDIEERDGRFELRHIANGNFKYEDEEEMFLFAKKKDAEFFYKTCSFLPYESYEKLVKTERNIAFLYDKNPYILCEKCDENGRPYAKFSQVDSITDLKTFDARLAELKLAAMYILNRNESEGHTWMPYAEFDARFKRLLKRGGHPLLIGDASAVLTYFSEFHVEEPFTPSSRVSKSSTRRMEYEIEKLIRSYMENDSLFRKYAPPDDVGDLTGEQTDAVSGAILSKGRFSVLTGGPGTGKTTVISAILDGMEASYPDVCIRLLAPTGKASKRIREQMGDRDVEVSTIHKFVGYGMEWMTKERKDELKKSGLIIIDESSMLDIEIFHMLLDEIDMENTKIILVGDENQLPSVGAGNVLHDVIAMGVPTFRLTINHRNVGSIHSNAKKIIEGESAFLLEEDTHFKIVDGGDAEFGYLLESMPLGRDRALISPYHAISKESSVPHINEVSKEHKFSVDRVSVRNQGRSMAFNLGDRVICTHTNYSRGYINGDTGVYAGKNGDMCHTIRLDGHGKTIDVCDGDLELAYAITIHKSQGSEYDDVVIFLPRFSRFITRRMLYTAVTRAKENVTINGDIFTIDEIIKNNRDEERRTMLGTLL